MNKNCSVPILGEDPPSSLALVFLKNDEQCSEENKKIRYVLGIVKKVMALINYVKHTRMRLSNTPLFHSSSKHTPTHLQVWRYIPFWALASL